MKEVSEHSKTIAKGSAIGIAGNLFFNFVSFLYVIMIARAASQDDVGLFYLAMSVISLLGFIDDLGLGGALVRYIPFFEGKNEKNKIRALLKSSYLIVSLSAMALMAILFFQADAIGAIYNNGRLPEVIRFISLNLLFTNIARINNSFLQSRGDIAAMQIASNAQNVAKLAFTLLAFHLYGPSSLTLTAGFIASAVLGLAISVLFSFRRMMELPESDETVGWKVMAHEIIPYGITMGIIHSFLIGIFSANRLLLGYLTSDESGIGAVAIYSIASSMVSVLFVFPSSIGAIFLPIMARLFGKNDIQSMRETIETAQRWTLFVTAPFALVMIVFSGEMLATFYGENYVSGALAMSILGIGILVRAVSYMPALSLASMRKLRINFFANAAGGIANILLNLALIPAYGIVGSALSSVAGLFVTLILITQNSKRHFGFTIPSPFYRLVGAAVVTLVIVLFLKPLAIDAASAAIPAGLSSIPYLGKVAYLAYLGLLSVITGIIFVSFVIVLRCFGSEDIDLMKKALQKMKVPPSAVSLAERVASYGIDS